MSRLRTKQPSESAQHIKNVARRLFAERGVDGVTVRDIAVAAGQKNHASVAYHFGSKEALVREIILDGAKKINHQRNILIERMEKAGGPRTFRDVVDIMIQPAISFDTPERMDCYNRFIVMTDMTHHDFLVGTLGNSDASALKKCYDYLRDMLGDMPETRKTQKLIFVSQYLGAVVAAREGRLASPGPVHAVWQDPTVLDHFADTVVAILKS